MTQCQHCRDSHRLPMDHLEETAAKIARLSLPENRSGLSSEAVAASQRKRLQLALALVSHRRGYEMASVDAIAVAAQLSKATLYALFGGKEGILSAAAREFDFEVRRELAILGDQETEWERRVMAAIEVFVGRVASEPELARLAFVEAPRVLEPEEGGEVVDLLLAEILDLDRVVALPAAGSDRERIEVAAVGGLREPLFVRLLEGRYEEITALGPSLCQFAITVGCGPERASELLD